MESQAPHRTLQPGEMLNWYRIERILGRGGFGVIYLATDTNLDHQVAIKEYIPVETASRGSDSKIVHSSDESAELFRTGMERFIKEARNLVKFKHPNIVRVMSVFQENNTAYMVMEFEEGQDLRSYLRKPGANSEPVLKQLIVPISKGLAEVHRRGFIHRDIKPANILVRNDGSPVLLDFGSARSASQYTQQNLTALISVGYAPLEQYNSESDDQQGPWTDIYALGGTLYNAISGQDPVESTRRGAAILNGGADPLISALRLGEGKYSEHFLKAIDWALAFAISDRPQQLGDWLPVLLEGESATNHNTNRDNDPLWSSDFHHTSSRPDTALMNDFSDSTMVSEGRPFDNAGNRVQANRTSPSQEQHGNNAGSTQTVSTKHAEYAGRTAPSSGLRALAFFTLLLSAGALALWFITDNGTSSSTQPIATSGSEASSSPVAGNALNNGEASTQKPVSNGDRENPNSTNIDNASNGVGAQGTALVAATNATNVRDQASELSPEALLQKQKLDAIRVNAESLVTNAKQKNVVEAAVKESERLTEKTKAAALEADAAKARTAQRQAELEKQAAIDAQQVREREALNAARLAAARKERRLVQAITSAQNSLSVGDLSAATRQLENAQKLDNADPRVETLAFAVQKALDAQDRPVSDEEFDSVARMFDGLRRAIETNDETKMDRLAISSQQSTIFKSLMKSFEKVDVSISNIRVRNADKSISAILRIDSMVRANGDRATPSDKYATRSIVSRRVNGGWSQIQW